MKISRNTVATLSFVVTDEHNQVLGRTDPNMPVEVLVGHGHLVKGLEKAIDGKEKGDEFTITLNPNEAYGAYDVDLVQSVPRTSFGDMELEVGAIYEAQTNNGNIAVVVKEIHEEAVIVDGNHPLSGKVLNFLVNIVDVREATPEEIAHGHVHANGVCPSDEEGASCCACGAAACSCDPSSEHGHSHDHAGHHEGHEEHGAEACECAHSEEHHKHHKHHKHDHDKDDDGHHKHKHHHDEDSHEHVHAHHAQAQQQ